MVFNSSLEKKLLMGNLYNQLQSCYSLMKQIICIDYADWIQANCPYFTDHGLKHIDSVISSASELIAPLLKNRIDALNIVETFLLLCSVLYHDAAMVYQRSGHAEKAKEILDKYQHNFPNQDFLRIIGDIVRAHGGKEGLKRPRAAEKISYNSRTYDVRPKLLASVLRFADEISENRSRISSEIIDTVPDQNKIFWQYANTITSSFPLPDSKRVTIVYSIDKSLITKRFKAIEFKERADNNGELSLIEYVICRLEKVNNERIYCSAFMEPYLEYKEVVAEITILNGLDRIASFDSVPFTFRDMGLCKNGEYPNVNIYNTFFNQNNNWLPDSLINVLS